MRDWTSYDCHTDECELCDDPRCECFCHSPDIPEDPLDASFPK